MINEAWFNVNSRMVFKNPTREKFEVATGPGVIETLEGPVRYETGHYIMTGPKGERYPITPDKFNALKDDNGDGTATPQKLIKVARLADHDGVLHTSWGDLAYTAGNDYIIRHGQGDYGAVKKDVFEITYSYLL